MPGVDLLDAFAELVVRVVFNLPLTENDVTSSSGDGDSDEEEDDDAPYVYNSSTTQIFSGGNYAEDEHQILSSRSLTHHSNNSTYLGSGAPISATSTVSCSNSISRGNSATSLDLYPGGIWNALARAPAMGGVGVSGNRPSRPSSTVSLGTGDILSTPRSGTSLWNRIVIGGGRTPAHMHGACLSPDHYTGHTTTTTSSFVQLGDEELGLGAAATGGDSTVGAAHGVDSGSSVMGGGSIIYPTAIALNSGVSTPVCEAYPLQPTLLCTAHPQQQLARPRDPFCGHRWLQSGSGHSECPSHHTRSSSEFDVL